MVTGANSGVGKATALALAQMGASVVMVCRDRARGEEARSEITTTITFASLLEREFGGFTPPPDYL